MNDFLHKLYPLSFISRATNFSLSESSGGPKLSLQCLVTLFSRKDDVRNSKIASFISVWHLLSTGVKISKPQSRNTVDACGTIKSDYGCIIDQGPYPNEDKYAKPQSGSSGILQSPKSGLEVHGCSLHLRNQEKKPNLEPVCIRPVTISKSRYICQSPAYPNSQNQDLQDIDVLCTFKIKIESQNLGHGCNKDQ